RLIRRTSPRDPDVVIGLLDIRTVDPSGPGGGAGADDGIARRGERGAETLPLRLRIRLVEVRPERLDVAEEAVELQTSALVRDVLGHEPGPDPEFSGEIMSGLAAGRAMIVLEFRLGHLDHA